MGNRFAIDNVLDTGASALSKLCSDAGSSPLDVATAYFSISGYRLLRDDLAKLGAFRLLLGHEPTEGSEIGLHPKRLRAELESLPFDEATLRLVEHLVSFFRQEKVGVRLYEDAFLHAKAYIFHQDRVGPGNYDDRLRPFAAMVGSSNFTGPGLTTNRELNLIHRVFTEEDPAVDAEAAERAAYLRDEAGGSSAETILDPSGVEVPAEARRAIKSEVGARAVMELERWFQRHWEEARDFKDELIDLLSRSKFGEHEYTPHEIYLKALYEYLRDQLEQTDEQLFGRSAVELTDFQAEAVQKARRVLQRYDGVLVADSVGLGKTWIGKKLLEDFAYHQRMKALVICPASLREMWKRELRESTIAAEVVGMEEMGREGFDTERWGDVDVILIDEAHNFRNVTSNRYLALDELIQRRGGRGREGERKKIILLTATPINNDLYDLRNLVWLFTQGDPAYFREAGIGDVGRYFQKARSLARREGTPPGELLFNLLEEFIIRNTRPYIRAAFPNATINGAPVRFPNRRLKTIEYTVGGSTGLYVDIANRIDALSLAPYALESYKKPDYKVDEFERGREQGLVGIFKTRYLKRFESSIEAFRLSVRRAIVFEQAYLDFVLAGRVVPSHAFHKAMRMAGLDAEDELGAEDLTERLEDTERVKEHLSTLETVDLNQYDLRRLNHDIDRDIESLKKILSDTEKLSQNDGKLERLKELLATDLKGQKILIFSSYKDTERYVHRELVSDENDAWRNAAGNPRIRRIDSGNHPEERSQILAAFAPEANDIDPGRVEPIDILISTDVLSEGQNLQDCGVMINYDLTWNPVRLVQRSGRIDRLKSPHDRITVYNMFPEKELEELLRLVERLSERVSHIDDLGFLDASVLGEEVHPRTFNTLRRIREEDGAVLQEEEDRAELAGPEKLLKDLREMLGKLGHESVHDLPDGIHSGHRRNSHDGVFFHFRAKRQDPKSGEQRVRHIWRYIDAASGEIIDNRFRIAQIIACGKDEPRFIGGQSVFELQQRVLTQIIGDDTRVVEIAAAGTLPDRVQLSLDETLKDMIRRRAADRESVKAVRPFLEQAVGRGVLARLKGLQEEHAKSSEDANLLQGLADIAREFGKPESEDGSSPLSQADLELVCFEHVSPN